MKLRNKKTGEIGYLYANKNENYNVLDADDKVLAVYPSLAELNEEWEDYEEPKDYWYIDLDGEIQSDDGVYEGTTTKGMKEIGNYFGTKEEVEKAVEKLKAIKRLKDKGFKFEGIKEDYTRILQSQDPFRTGKRYLQFNKSEDEEWMKENWKDLNICFGDEE